jgi:hypothetical protein
MPAPQGSTDWWQPILLRLASFSPTMEGLAGTAGQQRRTVATKERLTSSRRKARLTAESVTPERGHALASPNGGVPPRASEDTPLSIEERYDEVRRLIAIGKNNGYLLYDEVNEQRARTGAR